MTKVSLLLLLTSLSLLANNILFIGDSHTAGPFGKAIKKELSHHNIAVYGHSSSAPINWMYKKVSSFTGGIFHGAYIEGQSLINPRPIPWRQKAPTPKLKNFMSNMLKYSSWKNKIGVIKADTIVIALGANDSRAVARDNGEIIQSSYNLRQQAIIDMLNLVERHQLKCIWIGPPGSTLKPRKREDTLYAYLKKSINQRCAFFSSRHYIARKWLSRCDGIHFSCNETSRKLAQKWAKEVSHFIDRNL